MWEKGRRTIITLDQAQGEEMKETTYSLTIYHTGSLYRTWEIRCMSMWGRAEGGILVRTWERLASQIVPGDFLLYFMQLSKHWVWIHLFQIHYQYRNSSHISFPAHYLWYLAVFVCLSWPVSQCNRHLQLNWVI